MIHNETRSLRPINSDAKALSERGYSLGKKIGKGSYAVVLNAQYEEVGGRRIHLACKVIDFEKAPRDFIEKFYPREIEVLTKIEHPYIVQIHSIIQRGLRTFIFMRYADNGDLLDFIRTNGAIYENQSKTWFSQMVQALIYLQSKNIAHRDLKCENILLSKKMNIKLADFGFARYCKDKVGRCILSDTYCGSAAYAAPEVVKGIPYDPKIADNWSLGVILFIMLNAKMPFDDSNLMKLIEDQKSRRYVFRQRIYERTTQQARMTIDVLLEPDPKKRSSLESIKNSKWIKTSISQTNLNKDIYKVPLPDMNNVL